MLGGKDVVSPRTTARLPDCGLCRGEIGRIKDVYFDDYRWTVRYRVAETRNWPPGRHVVLSPQRIKGVDQTERVVNVEETRGLAEAASECLSDLGFSRAYAASLHRHYRQPTLGGPAK